MKTDRRATDEPEAGPLVRVVRGTPTEAELAALLIALLAVGERGGAARPGSCPRAPARRTARWCPGRGAPLAAPDPASPRPARAGSLTRRWTPR